MNGVAINGTQTAYGYNYQNGNSVGFDWNNISNGWHTNSFSYTARLYLKPKSTLTEVDIDTIAMSATNKGGAVLKVLSSIEGF